MEITKYAKAYGPNGLFAKIFYAIKGGKKKYLEHKYIERKIKKVDEFDKQLEKNVPRSRST